MKVATFFLFILCSICLLACENAYKYSYDFRNNADTTVQVRLKLHYGIDTTFYVPKDSLVRGCTTTHGVQGAKGPYYDHVTHDLDTCTISLRGHTSTRNYLDDSYWTFSKNAGMGIFTTTVTTAEF